MLQCETTAVEARQSLPQPTTKRQKASSLRPNTRPKRPSALNTHGNTTHEVRPTDVLLPLRLHPHIVLIARPRKQVCSSNAFLCARSCAQHAVLTALQSHCSRCSASSACRSCSWCSARGAQLRRCAGRSVRARSSARTPACGSAGTGPRAVQLCVRWCASSTWRASASAAREPASVHAQHQRLAQSRCLPLTPA